jgi:uncharacterized protein (TIGR03792 family)
LCGKLRRLSVGEYRAIRKIHVKSALVEDKVEVIMVIEWLKFKVAPGVKELFIKADRRIWTALLSQFPGFHRKSIWLNPKDETEIVIIIEWHTREDWSNVPEVLLRETEERFMKAVGKDNYKYLEQREYQVSQ